jgi:hypothetical protein
MVSHGIITREDLVHIAVDESPGGDKHHLENHEDEENHATLVGALSLVEVHTLRVVDITMKRIILGF